jgi:death on curing protein
VESTVFGTAELCNPPWDVSRADTTPIQLRKRPPALFESLSQNHPFLDGNKRTAVTAAGVFLLLNGYRLLFEDLEAYNWLIELQESGRMSKATIEPWLRPHAERI